MIVIASPRLQIACPGMGYHSRASRTQCACREPMTVTARVSSGLTRCLAADRRHLYVLPGARPRHHDLQAAQSIVQEGLCGVEKGCECKCPRRK